MQWLIGVVGLAVIAANDMVVEPVKATGPSSWAALLSPDILARPASTTHDRAGTPWRLGDLRRTGPCPSSRPTSSKGIPVGPTFVTTFLTAWVLGAIYMAVAFFRREK